MLKGFFHSTILVILLSITAVGKSSLRVQSTAAVEAYRVEWAAGDKLIVSTSGSGEIRVWRADSGALLQALPPVDPMAAETTISPDGALIAAARNGRAVVMERLTGKTIWEDKEAEAKSLTRLEPPFLTVASSKIVRRVDFMKEITTQQWNLEEERSVKQLGPLNDGATAVFLHDRTVVILDKDFRELGRIQSDNNERYYGGEAAGDFLALSALDGGFVASIKGTENSWRKATHSPPIRGLCLSPDGLNLAVGNLHPTHPTISIRSSLDRKEVGRLPAIQGIKDLAWSSDRSKLALAMGMQGIVVMDAKSGEVLCRFGEEKGFTPFWLPESARFDGQSKWFGISWGKNRFVQVSLSDGDVRFFDTAQSVQPPTRSQAESVHDLVVPSQPRYRFQHDGRLIERLAAPIEDAFGSGLCGSDGIYFRNRQSVVIQRTTEGKTEKEGMFPLGVTLECVFSVDGRYVIHEAPSGRAEYFFRKAPTWEVAGVIPKKPVGDSLAALWVSPDGQQLTWMGYNGMWSFDLEKKKRADLLLSHGPENQITPMNHASAPDWFILFSLGSGSPCYRVQSVLDGSVIYESKPWRAFAEEGGLMPFGVTANKRGLWMCGAGSRPILVDLETGQPVLRMHVFEGSSHLWETPEGIVAGSPEAKARCHIVQDNGMDAVNDPKLLNWDPEAVMAILRSYN